MKISARNQLKGTVKSIETGSVNAIVHIDIGNGNVISSTISIDAVKRIRFSSLVKKHMRLSRQPL